MTPEPHARPDISVCIANYNGANVLMTCLESVLTQTGDFRFEILIHDDASRDDAIQRVAEQHPQVRILRSTDNVGYCISNNRMAEVARGRFLLLLNNDATLRPGSLATLYSAACKTYPRDILGLPQVDKLSGATIDHGYAFDIFMNPIALQALGTHEAQTATGACLWVPRATWLDIGGFPPWFGSVAEDIYLCQAARLLGYRTFVLSSPCFDHLVGHSLGGGKISTQGSLQTTVRRRKLSERNKTAIMLACFPCWALVIVVPLHAAFLGVEALYLLLAGSGISKIRAIYGALPRWLWQNRHHIVRLRTRLQGARVVSGLEYMRPFRLFPHKIAMLARHGKPRLDN